MSLSDNSNLADYARPPVLNPLAAMGIGRIVALVLVPTFAGAIVGGLIGFSMGVLIPDFYRSTFSGGESINPVQTGTGLGISEGLMLGFILGVVIVLVQAFGRKRTETSAK